MKICGFFFFFLGGGGVTKSDYFLLGGGSFLYILGLFKIKIQNENIFRPQISNIFGYA